MPAVPKNIVKKIETLAEQFIWNNTKAKIPLETLKCDGVNGGLKLFDLTLRDKALKVGWVQTLISDPSVANLFHSSLSTASAMKNWIFDCNLKSEDVYTLNIQNRFWEDMLKAWCDYNYNDGIEIDCPIWLNSQIRIENKPFFWKKAYDRGLFRVSQLYERNMLISAKSAWENFSLTVMEYNALITAIPQKTKRLAKDSALKTGY